MRGGEGGGGSSHAARFLIFQCRHAAFSVLVLDRGADIRARTDPATRRGGGAGKHAVTCASARSQHAVVGAAAHLVGAPGADAGVDRLNDIKAEAPPCFCGVAPRQPPFGTARRF